MKILYVLLLLTTHTSSLLCMEQERPKKRTTSSEALPPSVNPCTILSVHVLSAYPNMPYATPVHAKHVSQSLPQNMPTCEANQPGWQYLNKIMNTSYQSNQPACASEFELKPIYKPAKTTTNNTAPTKQHITQEQQKPLLCTLNSTRPNIDIMKKLHHDAIQYLNNSDDKKFVCLINDMNYAKNNDIHEDMMIQFAIENLPFVIFRDSNELLTPLFFSCLKKYFITIKISQEAIAKDNTVLAKYTPLALIFEPNTAIAHPALIQLKKNINTISHQCNALWFLIFLYTSKAIPQTLSSESSSKSYDDLKYDFYRNASLDFICKRIGPLYPYIQRINTAKESHFIEEEKDFGYAMLTYKPSISINYNNFMSTPISRSYSSADIKNRISLFCSLIEKYNQTRADKITPSIAQYDAYLLHKQINFIPFPDSFDNTLFDENHYAFKEQEELIKTTTTLLEASDEDVQQWTNNLYPPRK